MGHPPDFEWGRDSYDNFDNKPEFFYPYRDSLSDGNKTGTMASCRANGNVCGLCHTSAILVQIECSHTDIDLGDVLAAAYSGGRHECGRGQPMDKCSRIICLHPAWGAALPCGSTPPCKAALRWNKDPGKAFLSTIILVVLAAVPLSLQPDLGTIILIFLVSMGMYVERIGWKWPVIAGGLLGGCIFPMLIFFEPYRMRRVSAFLDPWSDPLDKGFQAIQGLIAFSNGGFWGAGLGHGFQKLNYLPAAYTDFIYAAIGEELGLMGTLGVIGLFAFWVSQTKMIYYRVPDGFKTSLTWGVTLTVVIPLVINVAGVTKLIPLTGMPLPFISYGGTSLLTMWSRIGIMLRLEKESYLREG